MGAIKNILGSLLKDDEEDEVALKSGKAPTAETLAGENAEILSGNLYQLSREFYQEFYQVEKERRKRTV